MDNVWFATATVTADRMAARQADACRRRLLAGGIRLRRRTRPAAELSSRSTPACLPPQAGA